MWRGSLEEKVIGKVVLDKWGSWTIGASSRGAPAAAGPVEVDTDEADSAAGELFAAKRASGRETRSSFFEDGVAATQAQYMTWEEGRVSRANAKIFGDKGKQIKEKRTDRMEYNEANHED